MLERAGQRRSSSSASGCGCTNWCSRRLKRASWDHVLFHGGVPRPEAQGPDRPLPRRPRLPALPLDRRRRRGPEPATRLGGGQSRSAVEPGGAGAAHRPRASPWAGAAGARGELRRPGDDRRRHARRAGVQALAFGRRSRWRQRRGFAGRHAAQPLHGGGRERRRAHGRRRARGAAEEVGNGIVAADDTGPAEDTKADADVRGSDIARSNGPAVPRDHPGFDPWLALVQVGAPLQALAAANNPKAPAHPWIERDPATGVRSLKMPLPPPETARQLADAFSALADGFEARLRDSLALPRFGTAAWPDVHPSKDRIVGAVATHRQRGE